MENKMKLMENRYFPTTKTFFYLFNVKQNKVTQNKRLNNCFNCLNAKLQQEVHSNGIN